MRGRIVDSFCAVFCRLARLLVISMQFGDLRNAWIICLFFVFLKKKMIQQQGCLCWSAYTFGEGIDLFVSRLCSLIRMHPGEASHVVPLFRCSAAGQHAALTQVKGRRCVVSSLVFSAKWVKHTRNNRSGLGSGDLLSLFYFLSFLSAQICGPCARM